MASEVYNFFKTTVKKHTLEFKFCRLFVTIELLLFKSNGTQIVWKKNLSRMDVSSLSEFWTYLYRGFRAYIEEMRRREYEVPVQFQKIDLYVYTFNPLSGGTYRELPKSISATKAVINVKNKDNLCFLHSISALKFPAKDHVDRVTNYTKYLKEYKYDEADFPMSRIRYFEMKNNKGITVLC